jgi:hypothetical protein
MRWSLSVIWNSAGFLEAASAISTLVLIVGAVIEEWPKLTKIAVLVAKVLLLRSVEFERCLLKRLLIHSFGAILVVAGIVGELIFETRTFIVEDRETTALQIEAGNAKKSAEGAANALTTANERLTAIETRADMLNERLVATTTEADALSDQIESESGRMKAIIPRFVVLEDAKSDFVKAISPFAGQRVWVEICGKALVVEKPSEAIINVKSKNDETMGTSIILGNILIDSAKWRLPPRPLETDWPICPSMRGMEVMVNSAAPSHVLQAAKRLSEELTSVLPPQSRWVPMYFPMYGSLSGQPSDPSHPWTMMTKDPDLIVVLVGDQPFPLPTHSAKKSKPKTKP